MSNQEIVSRCTSCANQAGVTLHANNCFLKMHQQRTQHEWERNGNPKKGMIAIKGKAAATKQMAAKNTLRCSIIL